MFNTNRSCDKHYQIHNFSTILYMAFVDCKVTSFKGVLVLPSLACTLCLWFHNSWWNKWSRLSLPGFFGLLCTTEYLSEASPSCNKESPLLTSDIRVSTDYSHENCNSEDEKKNGCTISVGHLHCCMLNSGHRMASFQILASQWSSIPIRKWVKPDKRTCLRVSPGCSTKHES